MVAIILIVIGAAIFMSLGITELIEEKRSFIANLIICVCGACSFIVLVLTILLSIMFLQQLKKEKVVPQYELIQEPLYKKIN